MSDLVLLLLLVLAAGSAVTFAEVALVLSVKHRLHDRRAR
jgi:hypothetical protein